MRSDCNVGQKVIWSSAVRVFFVRRDMHGVPGPNLKGMHAGVINPNDVALPFTSFGDLSISMIQAVPVNSSSGPSVAATFSALITCVTLPPLELVAFIKRSVSDQVLLGPLKILMHVVNHRRGRTVARINFRFAVKFGKSC